jgi:hypothetical protein
MVAKKLAVLFAFATIMMASCTGPTPEEALSVFEERGDFDRDFFEANNYYSHEGPLAKEMDIKLIRSIFVSHRGDTNFSYVLTNEGKLQQKYVWFKGIGSLEHADEFFRKRHMLRSLWIEEFRVGDSIPRRHVTFVQSPKTGTIFICTVENSRLNVWREYPDMIRDGSEYMFQLSDSSKIRKVCNNGKH